MLQNNNKKIVIVSFADLGKRRNFKTADILPLISFLKEKGLISDIFCRINKNFDFSSTFSMVPEILHYFISLSGLLLNNQFFSRTLEEKIFDFSTAFKIKKLKERKIIFFHPNYYFLKSVKTAKEKGHLTIGLTVTAHGEYNANLEKEEFERLNLKKDFEKYAIYYRLLKKGFYKNNYDYLIAWSSFVKDTYSKYGSNPEKIFVAVPDVDSLKFFPSKERPKNFRVLYVAQTTILKGLHYLLDAWKKIKIKNAQLFLVGGWGFVPPRYRKRLESMIFKDERIKWINFTKNIISFYQNSSLFVFPSLTEGNPRVLREAMACGLPIITTENAKGLVENNRNGFIVPIRDAEALKEKIEFLCYNQKLREEMGQESRKIIEKKESFGSEILKIYERIVGQQ